MSVSSDINGIIIWHPEFMLRAWRRNSSNMPMKEQGHADQLAERIVQLGGEPNLSPERMLMRSHSEYVEGTSLVDMIKEDLVAERIAIDSYREMINYLGTNDSTSRRMLDGILAVEEEHADDLVSLLEEMGT
jgi:bacterioferritin